LYPPPAVASLIIINPKRARRRVPTMAHWRSYPHTITQPDEDWAPIEQGEIHDPSFIKGAVFGCVMGLIALGASVALFYVVYGSHLS
jgi:hypothetical protein